MRISCSGVEYSAEKEFTGAGFGSALRPDCECEYSYEYEYYLEREPGFTKVHVVQGRIAPIDELGCLRAWIEYPGLAQRERILI